MITSTPRPDDEFYIGYNGTMPRAIARRIRTAIVGFGIVAASVAVVAVLAVRTLSPARFEYGVVTAATGLLRRQPYPVLESGGRRIWLAGPGKFSADRVLAGVPDGFVTLHGSRIQRGRHEMLEVRGQSGVRPGPDQGQSRVRPEPDPVPTWLRPDSDPALTPGRVTLRGEIVDSKCFLGVMNPAEGPVHRDCARRCLSGGLPPMLLVRDGMQREELVLLVSEEGGPIGRALAGLAGRAIELSGRLVRDGESYVLYTNFGRAKALPHN
jgi:hypothetical protein